MNLLAFFNGVEQRACLGDEGEGVFIREDGAVEHLVKEQEGIFRRRAICVGSNYSAPGVGIWGVNVGEHRVRISERLRA